MTFTMERKLLVLPTWIIYKIMAPWIPEGHVWKDRNFTLADWAEHSTLLNDGMNLMFWAAIALFMILLSNL